MYQEIDELELANACSAGDRNAEDELYRRYAARVYSLCRRYVGDSEDAKDLMQEAMVKSLDKIRFFKYSGKGSLYGWIGRIAINHSLNYINRQRRRMLSLDMMVRDDIPEPNEEDMMRISEETLIILISKLPDMRRAVFNLSCIDGYSHKEIGEMLGISEKGSSSMLAKAKKQLKEEIWNYLRKEDQL